MRRVAGHQRTTVSVSNNLTSVDAERVVVEIQNLHPMVLERLA
jgi:hypothetical protein